MVDSQKNSENNTRIIGLDILKILAAFFVVILHVDGYLNQAFDEIIGSSFEFGYIFLETLAYPAIHIFVLCGSFFMVGKTIKTKQYIYIYLTTLFISLVGLFISVALCRNTITTTGILQCIFPFSFRAYGYVSTYLLLMLLSTYFNLLIDRIDEKIMKKIIVFGGLPIIVMPTLLYGVWEYSYFGLFVILYFIGGYAKLYPEKFFSLKNGLLLWFGNFIILIGSFFVFSRFKSLELLNRGNYLYFYHYNSIFVVGMAVGLFMALGNIKVKGKCSKLISSISGFTLIIYEYHMHPIIKTNYANWISQVFIIKSNAQYMLSVLIVAAVVFLFGCIIGLIVLRPLKALSEWISNSINKNWRIKNE